eukprot:ctg_1112.g348
MASPSRRQAQATTDTPLRPRSPPLCGTRTPCTGRPRPILRATGCGSPDGTPASPAAARDMSAATTPGRILRAPAPPDSGNAPASAPAPRSQRRSAWQTGNSPDQTSATPDPSAAPGARQTHPHRAETLGTPAARPEARCTAAARAAATLAHDPPPPTTTRARAQTSAGRRPCRMLDRAPHIPAAYATADDPADPRLAACCSARPLVPDPCGQEGARACSTHEETCRHARGIPCTRVERRHTARGARTADRARSRGRKLDEAVCRRTPVGLSSVPLPDSATPLETMLGSFTAAAQRWVSAANAWGQDGWQALFASEAPRDAAAPGTSMGERVVVEGVSYVLLAPPLAHGGYATVYAAQRQAASAPTDTVSTFVVK